MTITESVDEDGKWHKAYICHDGRILTHQKTEVHHRDGFARTFQVYASKSCDRCIHKQQCLYKYDEEKHQHKNKLMKINEK